MKNYSNYLEQVKDNVTDMVLFNNLTQVNEFWYEPLFEMTMSTIEPDDVYQFYMVKLNGSYNEEHERLSIFYDEKVGAYILPVFHFGTAWDYVSACD